MGGKRGQGQDIQAVVLENGCHEAPVPLPKPIEVALGDLETGKIAVALDTQESRFQTPQATIRQAMSKESDRRKEQIYKGRPDRGSWRRFMTNLWREMDTKPLPLKVTRNRFLFAISER